MRLTNEQQIAVDEFRTERDVKVIAYAGAGKTSTLVAMAEADEARTGLYIAFNKRIAEEAHRKFPFNVRSQTAHSLAYRSMVKQYEGDKLTKNPRMLDADIKRFGNAGTFSAANCRELVARTLRNFMQSDDNEIGRQHTPNLVKLGFYSEKDNESRAVIQAIDDAEHAIVRAALDVWEKMISKRNRLPLGFDGYLKLWAMSKPRLEADVLFVDEAQDLNPVLIGILRRQQCQVVAVGDSHQQIYEWRGAVDALNLIDGKRCRLTQSFRFGEQIAFEANRVLALLGETHELIGAGLHGTVESRRQDEEGLPDVDAILCRSNGGVIANAAAALEKDIPVYIPGGVDELRNLVQDAELLIDGREARPGELMAFRSWDEVRDFSGSVDGGHLGVFVRLVDKYGCRELRHILSQVSPEPFEDNLGLTVSTTHKAKGLEWYAVHVDEDFALAADHDKKELDAKKKVPASQVRLLYVAMTRAKELLSLPSGLLAEYENAKVTGIK